MTLPILKNRPPRIVRLPQDATETGSRIVLPRIHAQYAGGEFMGIVAAHEGCHHDSMIIDCGECPTDEDWNHAMQWAQDLGFYLPFRREQSVMFGNRREGQYKLRWYWSCEQYAGDERYSWIQGFGFGSQSLTRKDGHLRARAIKRVRMAT